MSTNRPGFEDGAVEQGGFVSPQTFDAAARGRLGGPGLRTFLNIAALWQLSERERLLALGSPARSTYHNWVSKARTGRGLSLPLDTLLRLSAMLGIHKDLRILFGDPQRGVQWLRSANQASLFGGQRPIDLIVSGSQMGIIDVRRFLDGWRGGISAGPVDDEIEDQAWNDGDILIVDG